MVKIGFLLNADAHMTTIASMSVRILSLIPLLFLPVFTLSAHPHMWIRGNIEPVLGPRGLVAVDIAWSFDEYNSSRYIKDYDNNNDGTIDPKESETIRVESLSSSLSG